MDNETPFTSSIQLIGLRGQLEGVRSELVSTNNGLQGIATLIRVDGAQDQQKLLDERREEQLLSERKIRVGQEDALERQVSASFVEPANKVEKTLNSTFNNISNALKFLFVGVIGGVFLKGLSKAVDIGKSTLTGVENLLKNIFDSIGSGLGSIKDGFGSVIKSIGGVVDDISKSISSLAKSPLKAISDAFNSILGKGTTPSTDQDSSSTSSSSGGGPMGSLQGFLRPITQLASGFGAGASALIGDYTNSSIYGTTALFPNSVAETSSLVYNFFGDKAKEGLGNITNQLQNSNFLETLSIPNIFGTNVEEPNLNASTTEMAAPAADTVLTSTTQSASAGPMELKVVPFRSDQSQVQTPPTQQRNLQPPAEPAPDVVYLQSGNQQESTISSSGGGTLTDVPLIPSANPDNFYTLYAQLNYNVVI